LTALEELSTFFLYAKWRRTHDEVPLMYDLTWPSHSPIVLVQQFLSTGLAAERRAGRPKASWVKVFLAILKVHSFQALCRASPTEALRLRRSLVAASTSVEIRQGHRFRQWPCPLAMISDERRYPGDQQETAARAQDGVSELQGSRLRPPNAACFPFRAADAISPRQTYHAEMVQGARPSQRGLRSSLRQEQEGSVVPRQTAIHDREGRGVGRNVGDARRPGRT
jgi:hypothetical protein